MTFLSGETKQETKQPENSQPNQGEFVSKVVQAKGDQWSDPETLAKGYISAQEYINQLEAQAKEMKEDLDKQDYSKSLLDQLQNRGKPPEGSSVEEPKAKPEDTTPKFSEDELKNLIEKTLSDRGVQETRSSNIRKVEHAVNEIFGDKSEDVLREKANSYGLSEDDMVELAAKSPEAFMSLVTGGTKSEDNRIPNNALNTEASSFSAPSKRDWQYYQKLRKENKSEYYSPKVQQQLFEDRMAQGDSFYPT